MLRSLQLDDVGPASSMSFEFGERVNVLTGDNGLGKSFVLDLVWWLTTGSWVGFRAQPSGRSPRIRCQQWASEGDGEATFAFAEQRWIWSRRPEYAPRGPVIYLSTDRLSVFDHYRNYYRHNFRDPEHPDELDAFRFDTATIWDGLSHRGRPVCNGLIRDWVSWMRSRPTPAQDQARDDRPAPFELLELVLRVLSPSAREPIVCGQPRRVFVDDSREMPTLRNRPGGEDVPVVLASAGFRRILSLAYLLVWTWTEHEEFARLRHLVPKKELILLIDEVEMHLHPQWQRRILPALLEVARALDPAMKIQLFCTTHSPLVLASLETLAEDDRDRLFNFDVEAEAEPGSVRVDQLRWYKRGDANGWLTSEVFDLQRASSEEAERAIRWADAWMTGRAEDIEEPDMRDKDRLERELERVLAAHDRFWVRWWARTDDGGELGSGS